MDILFLFLISVVIGFYNASVYYLSVTEIALSHRIFGSLIFKCREYRFVIIAFFVFSLHDK